MNMRPSIIAGLILNTILCWSVSGKERLKDGEIEVKLQFLEYELEDYCNMKNQEEWKFLNGSEKDLKKYFIAEVKESDFYRHEIEILQKHLGRKFSSERLQRLVDAFSHPGAPLLSTVEFSEYRDYSVKLQELVGTMKILCPVNDSSALNMNESSYSNSSSSDDKCNPIDARSINKVLYGEKNEEKLKDLWIKWYESLEDKNKKTKYDFVQQLTILDLEAEQNGEEELTDYWLKQGDTTWVDFETVKNTWRDILPLYEKLKKFMSALVTETFGKGVIRDEKIPAHVLGSLVSHDWITAAEKLGAFEFSDLHKSLQQSLSEKRVEDLYRAADNQTAELKLGYLPQNFYENSRFNVSSQTCRHKMMDYCEKEGIHRAMFCSDEVPNVRHYIDINENVMRLKCQFLSGKEEEENGYLFREGPRDSVLYEAMEGLSSLRALWPEYLESQQLLMNHTLQQKTMLSLLLTALHVIPPLPYYLASDLWRINALREVDAVAGENTEMSTEPIFSSTTRSLRKRVADHGKENDGEPEATKTYDTQNLTRDWWSYREQYQGIGTPDGGLYEDYLQDLKIIWNKPYLSKFLGKILQFQILEKSANLTSDLQGIQFQMRKGKSKSWQVLVQEAFNVTEISAAPLLKYFKPLEEFLDKGTNAKSYKKLFHLDDFVSQEISLNHTASEGEKPAENSDVVFFSLTAIGAIGIVALIISIGRTRYKKRMRSREKRKWSEY